MGLADAGYESLAHNAALALSVRADSVGDRPTTASDLCIAQLWRVSRGDTIDTRRAITRVRELVKPLGPAPNWGVGKVDLCPLLLEAALGRGMPSSRSPAIDRVERLLLRGVMAEQPGNFANLIVARWREAQGDYKSALTVIRRRDPMAMHLAHPASWRLEGRLAALVGDTAGAIHAYTRYLEIRDRPDPGPMAEEARAVRAHLAALTARKARGAPATLEVRRVP
jgi:hypothetical protein